jgi:hypothetical protein
MTGKDLHPMSDDVQAVLAAERPILAQPDDVRRRAVARARSTLAAAPSGARLGSRLFERKWFVLAAAVLVAGTLSAAAAAVRVARLRVLVTAPLPAPAAEPEPRAPTKPNGATADSLPSKSIDEPAAEAVAAEKPSRPTRAPSGPEGYVLERKLLEPARAAIAGHDYPAALAAIAVHERRFPSGQLAEEREALRVQALVGEHRTDEARRAASAFRKRFPNSVLLPRMAEPFPSTP